MDKLPPRPPTSGNVQSASKSTSNLQKNQVNDEGNIAPLRKFARPINRALLESPTVGVKKEKPRSPTLSLGPRLRTAARAAEPRQPSEAQQLLVRTGSLRQKSTNQSPSKRFRQATKPQPFQFRTDRIHEREEARFRKMIMEEEAKLKAARKFRTDGMPDFANMPVFCPKFGDPKKTEPLNVVLHSDIRAEAWREIEDRKKQKEKEYEEWARRRELEKRREEEEETRKLRQALVHKAQPIKNFKPVEVKRNVGVVTIPQTPVFQADLRLQQRNRRI